MTTANLQVDIDTSQAFESLKRLRAEMQNQPHKLLISVDPTSVDQDIQRYLKQRTFKISVNTRAMGEEIANDVGAALDRVFSKGNRTLSWNVAALRGGMNAAVDGAFNDSSRRMRFDRNRLVEELDASVQGALGPEHLIRINREALTASVREAVAAGLSGGVVSLGGAIAGHQQAAAGLGADVSTVIQRTLGPAVDKLTTAAELIASVARKAGVSQPAGELSAKQSISVKDPPHGLHQVGLAEAARRGRRAGRHQRADPAEGVRQARGRQRQGCAQAHPGARRPKAGRDRCRREGAGGR